MKFNEIMYKVTNVDSSHYPYVVLELLNTATGETKYWYYSTIHYEELYWQLDVNLLVGCTLSLSCLPRNGGWIDKKDITFL